MTIFTQSQPGRRAARFIEIDGARSIDSLIPADQQRADAARLPEVSELDVTRHYNSLTRRNVGVDSVFYPLGSCTMKFNPRENEAAAAMEGFAGLHPLQDDDDAQGMLAMLGELQSLLCEITGMDTCSLVPVAGAQGEFAGVSMMAAYHDACGATGRTTLLVPDTAHGTNPASAAMCGFDPVEIPSRPDGRVDLEALEPYLNDSLAGIMLTNPNTLGLFENDILAIAERVHEAGGLLYYDGANLNAIVGRYRPGDMGFDIVHMNVHKTFSTPHGSGGPGAGPVAVRSEIEPFLPAPRVVRDGDRWRMDDGDERSIGRLHAFAGNIGVAIRAYTYLRRVGREGLRRIADHAVLNANYLKACLRGVLDSPYEGACMHEFTVSLAKLAKEDNVRAFDVAKRLLDLGFYAPTVYFPLLVKESMLIEPTETESLQTLDAFVGALKQIRQEADNDADFVRAAPHTTPSRRLDDVQAARKPVLNYFAETE